MSQLSDIDSVLGSSRATRQRLAALFPPKVFAPPVKRDSPKPNSPVTLPAKQHREYVAPPFKVRVRTGEKSNYVGYEAAQKPCIRTGLPHNWVTYTANKPGNTKTARCPDCTLRTSAHHVGLQEYVRGRK